MKRLSALAQLVRRLIADGITTTAALAAETEYTERAIRKARAELECRNQSAESGTRVPETEPEFRVSPLKKGLPHTPSKEIHPSSLSTTVGASGEVAAADAAQPPVARAGRYAFEGRVVRLTHRDLERWRKAYPAIPDLNAALTAADDYYAENLKPGEKWFHRVSRWLANENGKAVQAAKPPPWLAAEHARRAEVRQLLGLEVAQ